MDNAKVKQNWLISFVLYYVILIFLKPFIFRNQEILSNMQALGSFFTIRILAAVIIMWIVYYCVYKKSGTKWLALMLFSLPLELGVFDKAVQVHFVSDIFILVYIVVIIYYWINCLWLYKSNSEKNLSCAQCVSN